MRGIGLGGAFRPPRPARTNLWRLDCFGRCDTHRHGRAHRPFQTIPGLRGRWIAARVAGPIGWTRSMGRSGPECGIGAGPAPSPWTGRDGRRLRHPGTALRRASPGRDPRRRSGADYAARRGAEGVWHRSRIAARPIRLGLPDRQDATGGLRSIGDRTCCGDRRGQPSDVCGVGRERWRAAGTGGICCAPGALSGVMFVQVGHGTFAMNDALTQVRHLRRLRHARTAG